MNDNLLKLLSGGRFPNNKNRVWTMCQVTLKLATMAIEEAEKHGFTDAEFFIAFEDALNTLSVKDHSGNAQQTEDFVSHIKTFMADSE